MSNGEQMMNDRNLVRHIRAVMAPANPVPASAFQSERADVPNLTDLLSFDEAQPRPVAEPRIGRDDRAERSRTRSRTPAWRVLAPALSGLAVVAVTVSVVALASTATPHRTGGTTAAGSAAAGFPAMYLTVNGPPPHGGTILHDSRTGQILVAGKTPFPAGAPPVATEFNVGHQQNFQVVHWLRLRGGKEVVLSQVSTRSPQGHTDVQVTTLKIKAPGPQVIIEGIAHCTAGTAVALGVPRQGGGLSPQIQLVTKHQVLTWSAPGSSAILSDLSCTRTSKLAFLLTDEKTLSGQVRELNLKAPGHSLLTSGVIASSGGRLGTILSAYASQKSGPIVATIVVKTRHQPAKVATIKLVAISPQTGKVIKTFATFFEVHHGGSGLPAAKKSCQVMSLDSTGQHALVVCGGLHRLDGSKLTSLPDKSGSFGSQIIAAAW